MIIGSRNREVRETEDSKISAALQNRTILDILLPSRNYTNDHLQSFFIVGHC